MGTGGASRVQTSKRNRSGRHSWSIERVLSGRDSFAPGNAAYLTTEQILADYAELITHLKATLPGAANCPVVAFGGSYGAKLTARTKKRVRHASGRG